MKDIPNVYMYSFILLISSSLKTWITSIICFVTLLLVYTYLSMYRLLLPVYCIYIILPVLFHLDLYFFISISSIYLLPYVELLYDPSCPSAGWSVCHNFLKWLKVLSEHLFILPRCNNVLRTLLKLPLFTFYYLFFKVFS